MADVSASFVEPRFAPSIPDDVLIDAARMFYPDVAGIDSNSICAAALRRLRDLDQVEGIPNSAELARWRESDPVCIAYFAMLFVSPVLASEKAHQPWFDRLLILRKEREKRRFGKPFESTNGGEQQ